MRSRSLHFISLAALAAYSISFVTGCSDFLRQSTAPNVVDLPGASPSPVSEFPGIRRIKIDMTASGPFLPGQPIQLSVRGVSRFSASALTFKLIAMDEDPLTVPGASLNNRLLSDWRGALGASGEAVLHGTVTFPRPGYYRIVAVATNTPGPSDVRAVRDTLILDQTQEHLWIVVDEEGGRLTEGFDPTAIPPDQIPLYGAYGPFKSRRAVAQTQGGDGASARSPKSALSVYGVSGVLRYANYDLSGAPLTPVPGAEVAGICNGKSDPLQIEYDLHYPVSTTTASDGSFGIVCADGYDYVTGNITLRNADVYSAGKNGAYAGSGISANDGDYLDLRVANDYAARVFLDLRTFVLT